MDTLQVCLNEQGLDEGNTSAVMNYVFYEIVLAVFVCLCVCVCVCVCVC